MDKKFFIRGFGFGVLFATVILGIMYRIESSDSAIVQRAKELGMVYAEQDRTESLSIRTEESAEPSASSSPASTPAKGKKTQDTPKPSGKQKVLSSKEDPDAQKEMDESKQKMEDELQKAEQEFSIQAGEWSSQVSRRLEDQKLISDALDFDNYLEKNGYSDKIKAGTFSIKPGESYEEIARKITTR